MCMPWHTCEDQRYSHELILSFYHAGPSQTELRSSGLHENALLRVTPVIRFVSPILSSIFALCSEMVIEERFLLLLINWLSEMK